MQELLNELDRLSKGRITSDAMAYVVLAQVARLSPAYKEKVGCVICDFSTDEILSVGFNYNPYFRPTEFCKHCKEPATSDGPSCACGDSALTTHPDVVHAEIMAIGRLKKYIDDKIAYVTKVPCKRCAEQLRLHGVIKIVVLNISGLKCNGESHGRVSGTI